MSKHTPGPWEREPYDETGGYDCMTGGIRVGPVTLDARDYGQPSMWNPGSNWEQGRERMEADARLIAAAPELLAVVKGLLARDLALPYAVLRRLLDVRDQAEDTQ